jgi:hypothetical protein
MTGETISDETQAQRGYGFWIAFALLAAPFLYVLGVGPAA